MTVKAPCGMDGTTVLASSTLCFPTKLAVVRDPDPSGSSPEKRGGRGLLWRPWVSEQSACFWKGQLAWLCLWIAEQAKNV